MRLILIKRVLQRCFRYLIIAFIFFTILLFLIMKAYVLVLLWASCLILILPKLRIALENNFSTKISGKQISAIFTVLLISSFLYCSNKGSQMKNAENEVLLAEFNSKRTQLISMMSKSKASIEERNITIQAASKYKIVADPEFNTLYQVSSEKLQNELAERNSEIREKQFNLVRSNVVAEMKYLFKNKQDSDVIDLGNQYAEFHDKDIDIIRVKAEARFKKYQNGIEKEQREMDAHVEKLRQQDQYKQELLNHRSMAFVQCKNAVKESLRAPSTADFKLLPDYEGVDEHTGIITIKSFVDAQNAFGAMLRNNFICKMHYSGMPKDQWTVVEIKLY